MRFKILLITVTLLTISMSIFAKPVIDSVGVKNNDGKKMILFKVKAKDTYYSIGRRYKINPKALMKFNGAKKETLSIGAIVEVPTEIPFKKSAGKETAEKKEKPEKKEAPEKVTKETKKEKKARLAREAAEAKAEKKHKHKEDTEPQEKPEKKEEEVTEHVTQQPVTKADQVQQQVQQNDTPPTQYKVSAGETLYAISKRFNTTVDEITKLNHLTSTTVVPGQVLMVRTNTPAPPPPPPAETKETPVPAKQDPTIVAQPMDSSNSDHHLNPNKFGLYEKEEKGVATWIDDPSLDPTKKLVLHKYAPIGTVIKITNPMTNRTTFAKVVGRYTDSESTKDVIIVITKNVADSLGALDKRFHVLISYGSPNE